MRKPHRYQIWYSWYMVAFGFMIAFAGWTEQKIFFIIGLVLLVFTAGRMLWVDYKVEKA